ncbi:MAG: DNA-binding response regulator [Gemmatimonadetes bacterium]|nr:DNA-binding response regulator [Gemmatimonadota bacterium]
MFGIDEGALRIVLADDHPVVREGLKLLINAQPGMSVVAEAEDGQGACAAAKRFTPDVLIMDLSMPGMSGTEALVHVRRDCPDVKVLVLTVHEEGVYLTQVLKAGASGYVLKRAAAAELIRAVRTVAAGRTYVDAGISDVLVESYLDAHVTADRDTTESLSRRERDVLVRIASGFSNKAIATELGLSVKTVETYKSRFSEKLGLTSRVDIVRYAIRRGWLAE